MEQALLKNYGLELIKDLVKDSNTSRIYGFILYTEQNPYIAKVLRDSDFWNALDTISGANWPIFAVRPFAQDIYSSPNRSTNFHPQEKNISSSNTIGFIVHSGNKPSDNLPFIYDFCREDSKLRDYGLEDPKMLPCFVAFIWDDNDNLQSIAISIEGNDVDTTYKSIKEIVEVITNAEKHVLPQYKNNVEVFNNVSKELEALKTKHKVKKWGKITKRFIELFSLFK